MMPLEGRGFESHPLRQRGARAANFASQFFWDAIFIPRIILITISNILFMLDLRTQRPEAFILLRERFSYRLRTQLLAFAVHMAVHVACCTYVAVTEPLLNQLHLHSVGEK